MVSTARRGQGRYLTHLLAQRNVLVQQVENNFDATGYVRRNVASDVPDGTQDNVYIGTATNASTPSLYLYASNGRARLFIGADGVSLMRLDASGNSLSFLRLYDTGQLQTYRYSDAIYRPLPFAAATGSVLITGTGAAGGVTAAITFPSGRFTQAPILIATARTTGDYIMANVAAAPTTSGGSVRLTNTNGIGWASAHTVHWVAIQMEA